MPTLFELLNIRRLPNSYIVRQEKVKREGSPSYPWTPGAITASGGTVAISVPDQFPESRKYQPLDWLRITNNENTNDLTLTINNRESHLIPAGTIWTFDNLALWHIKLTNNGGTNTTQGKIYLTMEKQPQTIDKWARRQ